MIWLWDGVDGGLKHRPTTSLRLSHTKIHPSPQEAYQHKGAPICPSTASQGAKTLCINMTWLGDAVSGELEPQPWTYNITQTQPLPIFSKNPQLTFRCIRLRVHPPYAHPQHLKVLKQFAYMGVWSLNHDLTTTLGLSHAPIIQKSTASQAAKTLCMSNMDVGCSQWGFLASTMILKHHTGSAIPHFS